MLPVRKLPSATYVELNNSTVPPSLLDGSHGVILPTTFGPATPVFVNTVDQLQYFFGGPSAQFPLFTQLRRAISRGTNMLVQRLIATGATAASHDYGVGKKVVITAKDVGTWANGVLGILYVPAAAPALAQLTVVYGPNPAIQETWTADTFVNLIAAVNAGSKRITITTTAGFVELDATAGVPVFLTAGTDGNFANQAAIDAAVLADLANFNNQTALETISAPGTYSLATLTNLATYASGRGDLMALYEVDPTMTAAQAIAFAQTINFKNSYCAVYYGSLLTAFSPELATDNAGPIIMDVQAVYSFSDTTAGNKFRAPAGGTRGLIPNVKTFATNLLAPSQSINANQLVALGVNIVGNHPQFGPCVFGGLTLNQNGDSLDAVHARRILIELHKELAAIFQAGLFDPQDPTTWRRLYGQAKIVLSQFEAGEAIYPGWAYIGDQEASRVQDARYNLALDLATGLYKVQITLVIVGFINQIVFTVQLNNLLSLFKTSAS